MLTTFKKNKLSKKINFQKNYLRMSTTLNYGQIVI